MARPLVIAHRGASGHALENSCAAFREAVRLGADGVELDVHATRDGDLVVHHNPALPGQGPIADLPTEAVRSCLLANGEPIPLLAEALSAAAPLQAWIEVKALPPQFDGRLLETLDRAPSPDRCAVHSFDHRLIRRLGGRRPSLRLGVLMVSYLLEPTAPLHGTGARFLWQEWSLIDRPLVDAAHAARAQVIAWTVNDRPAALALARLGVDGLCGNYPERLRLE